MKNILKSERLRLRAVEPSDLDLLFDWENDTDTWQISNTQTPFSKEILSQFVHSPQDIYTSKQLRLMISLVDAEITIGAVDLFNYEPRHQHAGVGILISEKYRHQNFGFEALELLKLYALHGIGIRNLTASIHSTNLASLNLFQKAGFNLVGVRKNWYNNSNKWEDEHIFQCYLL